MRGSGGGGKQSRLGGFTKSRLFMTVVRKKETEKELAEYQLDSCLTVEQLSKGM